MEIAIFYLRFVSVHFLSHHDQIPVYNGANRGLVFEYQRNRPPYHGEDGFGNAKFNNTPDVTKIRTDESACSAILRLVKSMPGNTRGRCASGCF